MIAKVHFKKEAKRLSNRDGSSWIWSEKGERRVYGYTRTNLFEQAQVLNIGHFG